MSRLIDLTGKRFGRLTVIRRDSDYISPHGYRTLKWVCKCDCGNFVSVTRQSLKSSSTKSCGCLRSESGISMSYTFFGEAVICKCGTGKSFLIDAEDYPKIKDHGWHIGKNGYVYKNDTKETLHRLLTSAPEGYVVDHINHDTLDNRKSNLRVTTFSVNGYNKKIRTGASGEPFITYNKSNGYYCVYVDAKYRGGSKNLDKARHIRDEALKDSDAQKYNYFLKDAL